MKRTSSWRPANRSTWPATFHLQRREGRRGPELRGCARRLRSGGRWQVRAQDESGKAQLPLLGHADDRSLIDAGLLRDVYVSLGEPIDRDKPEGEWAVRVYYKPFVDWIWGGCVLMSLGGLIAMLDRRYRVKARAQRSFRQAPSRHEENCFDATPSRQGRPAITAALR
jgi:hypothetical protein